MLISEFMKLKAFKPDEKFKGLNVGDKFLFGEHTVKQKEDKSLGEEVIFYTVTEVREDGHMFYEPKIERLKES